MRGATVIDADRVLEAIEFQSTLPVRGATPDDKVFRWSMLEFQSTLPVRGATGTWGEVWLDGENFNPRSP